MTGNYRRSLQSASLVIGILLLLIVGYATLRSDDPHHSVFGTYWASGRAALHGQNPYAPYPETYRSHFGGRPMPDLNLNPPVVLPALAALARLPMATFGRVWTALSLLSFIAAILLLYRELRDLHPFQLLWLFAMTPTLNTVSTGQIYGTLFLLAAVGLVLARRGHLRLAGLALGVLVAIKPTMGFFLPLLWFAGYWQSGLYAGAAAAILSDAILFFYPYAYLQWFAALRGDLHWLAPTDIAVMAVARRHDIAWTGVAIAFAAAIALMVWIGRTKPPFTDTCGLAACAGIVCAPLAWHTYILVAAPFFVARRWNTLQMSAAFLLVIPTALAAIAGSTTYLIAVAVMLVSFSRWPAIDGHQDRQEPGRELGLEAGQA